MKRINLFRNSQSRSTPARQDSVVWGKINLETAGAVAFAALLIVCSLAVGCSSDSSKSAGSNQPIITPPTPPAATTPMSTPPAAATEASAKPVQKKAVRRVASTVTYVDKTTGVSFQYPRKYTLKTGAAADELVSLEPVPMNFAQPGGVALAAIAVPESVYPKSNLSAAFFNVSVNKALTLEQCGEFSEAKQAAPLGTTATADAPTPAGSEGTAVQPSKLMIGKLEMLSSETLASQGTREEESKYYHVFENGACYEFALKVATTGDETEGGKPVDRKEVFARLEKILASVKINPVIINPVEVEKETPSTPAKETPSAPATSNTSAATPAQ